MQPAELEALLAEIRESDEEIAAMLDVPAARLQRWRVGAERVPRYEARLLRFFAASAERGRALERSGLRECAWIAEFDEAALPDDTDAMLAALEREERHRATCPQCQARERFVEQRFGPMPPYPTKGLMSVLAMFERLPDSVRPAAYGASALAAITSLRLLFTIPAAIAKPALAVEALVAVLAAAGAGASGGVAYTLVRPAFKRLGRLGDYLTGITCAAVYMTSLVLVSPIAFDEPGFDGPGRWYVVGFTTLLFGLIMGRSWFGPSASARSGADPG